MGRTYHLIDRKEAEVLQIERTDDGDSATHARFDVELDERSLQVEASAEGHRLTLVIDGVSHACQLHELDDGRVQVFVNGFVIPVRALDERAYRRRQTSAGDDDAAGPNVISPMAGRVVAVEVAPGEAVESGQTLVIVEAMKMENDIKAHRSGVVESVDVEVDEAVEIGTQLVRIES